MVTFHIITLFPDAVSSYLNSSILGRAEKSKKVRFNLINLRKFGLGKHAQVDSSPYGGGAGMVLKIEPIWKAVNFVKKRFVKNGKARIILFSTRGTLFNQSSARRLAKYNHLILICGRYEGVDERVAENIADEEISVGDFVLSGGEIPAMILVDSVSRHVPGVLGKNESLEEVKGSYPVYTKPDEFKPKNSQKSWKVPGVLLSGNHKKIAEWRNRDK